MGKLQQVIIGASAAGLAAIEAIRRVDQDCPITVVSKEPMPLYSRVGLTHFISREVGYDGMRMRDNGYFDRMRVRGVMMPSRSTRRSPARKRLWSSAPVMGSVKRNCCVV